MLVGPITPRSRGSNPAPAIKINIRDLKSNPELFHEILICEAKYKKYEWGNEQPLL